MSVANEIPEALREQILSMPEYSMGVTRIQVTLDDGSRFGEVFVAWGTETVKVGVSTELPFDATRIIAVDCP